MAPPDGPRESFRPVVRLESPRDPQEGFTPANTSGLDAAELASLNAALRRLRAAGLSERDAKLKLDAAVRTWLLPLDAAHAPLERLRRGHEGAP